jgi:hypothetical protein
LSRTGAQLTLLKGNVLIPGRSWNSQDFEDILILANGAHCQAKIGFDRMAVGQGAELPKYDLINFGVTAGSARNLSHQ